jgi:carboxyl-terminal processing protease
MKRPSKRPIWLVMTGSFLSIVVVFFALSGSQVPAYAEEHYADLQNFSKVLNLIQQFYVEEVDTKKLIYGAIKGMLRELDPHTNFMPPDIFKDFQSETSGEFGGLGIEISIQNGILTIISPIEDTPAWNAGIKPGDKVVAVDGKSTKGLSLVEASQLMRGKRGAKIVLRVIRDNEEEPRDIVIIRGSVKIKSVKYTDLGDGYVYVKLTSFIENTAKDLEKTLDQQLAKYKSIQGMILDLRRNPGGLLDQAIKVSDLFLKDGTIVSTIARNKKDKEIASATKKGRFTDFPLIIIVNEFSASASEIVAGALQDNRRALIVGERTFGKGSVQSVVPLNDGSGLKLTVARYYTPSGVSIQAEGIKPDIDIEEVDAESLAKIVVKPKGSREKDIQGHLRGDREKVPDDKDHGEERGAEHKDSRTDAGALVWWKDVSAKKEETMTPKEKLFKADYQAYQAFGFLKAWKTMKRL